jgi:hypothetical protein
MGLHKLSYGTIDVGSIGVNICQGRAAQQSALWTWLARSQ